MKKRKLWTGRCGTWIRDAADALISTKGKMKWWLPESKALSRAARSLRDEHGWPIEDRLHECGRHEYRLDPERRSRYEFV